MKGGVPRIPPPSGEGDRVAVEGADRASGLQGQASPRLRPGTVSASGPLRHGAEEAPRLEDRLVAMALPSWLMAYSSKRFLK